jgi:PAS domain S-box-containing protein
MTESANILLVDDKVDNIFALERILARKDRNIIRASDGKEALRTVLNKEIDLIILDVRMPGMGGFEVAQILRSDKRSKDIPILFATADKTEYESNLKGFDEGSIDYLYKPLDAEITEAKASMLLRLQHQRKELIQKNLKIERYDLLINHSADIICIINGGTLQFEEVNLAIQSILGYTVAEIEGSSILSYLDGADQPGIEKLRNDNRQQFSFETRLYSKDREVKWLDWNILNKNGLWFANARDITQQEKTRQEILQLNTNLNDNAAQLESANNDLESFSYSVSHDLRAPLRAVNAYTQIILDEYSSQFDVELKRLFLVIQTRAQRMDRLINDLLAFARMGKRTVNKVSLDFDKQVRQVIAELEGQGKINANIVIHPLKSARGDAGLTYQVWTNLISNAIKYSGKRTTPLIEIGFAESPNEYIYSVKDNGTGFNMDQAHKLFGVFQRLHDNNDFEGTGIGLAIVKRVIAKHGGSVWAEGEPDKGATFYFSLPRPVA